MKNKKCVITSACLLLVTSFSATAEDSPLSPKFVLSPGQILSNTELGYAKTDFNAYINFPGFGRINESTDLRAWALSQSLRKGFSSNVELGIGVSYSGLNSSNDNLYSDSNGFYSPTIFGRKSWGVGTPIQTMIFGSITPKTSDHGYRSIPTEYSLGGKTSLTTPNGLVTSLSLSRNFINGDQENSTDARIGAYKEVGQNSFDLSFNFLTLDDAPLTRRPLSIDSVHTITGIVGRKLEKNMWLQLYYSYADGSYQNVQINPGAFLGASYDRDQVGVVLKMLFQ